MPLPTAPNVLVFDSGVGGLSILAELRRALPQCQLTFACDNEQFPYGTKDERTLTERVDKVLKALIRRVNPDIIVVACNSASTLVLPRIRSHFNKPVVGVVPAVKPAAKLSTTKRIGLLATPGTVKRQYTKQLITDFASDCTVISVGSSELVALAEQKLRGEAVSTNALKKILAPFLAEPELDTMILACTHFPLLRDELSELMDSDVQWVDSGQAIARRVQSLLPELSSELPRQTDSLALFTELPPQQELLAEGMAKYGCMASEILTV